MWLVCGFCAGCLFGLLFRNGLASGVFALFVGVLLAAVWVPSLLHGGLHFWQAFGPPLLLLAVHAAACCGRGRRAASRRGPRPPGWRRSSVLAAAVDRVRTVVSGWEIPDVAPKYDLAAFRASLPKPDENKAGDRVRGACGRFAELWAKIDAGSRTRRRPPPACRVAGRRRPRPRAPQAPSIRRMRLVRRCTAAGRPGTLTWTTSLAGSCDDEWRTKAGGGGRPADGHGGGPTAADRDRPISGAGAAGGADGRRPGGAAACSGRRHGNDAAFVEDLRVGLSLSRNLRHFAPRRNAAIGKAVEDVLLRRRGPLAKGPERPARFAETSASPFSPII